MFTIMAIKIIPRNSLAPKVQEILTRYGCIIQTRLGLHEAREGSCSPSGLIILNLLSENQEEIEKLSNELNNLEGITAKIITL
ncbi:MAG: hypothetical protein ACRC2K_11855 [Clostridium sp.]